MTLKAGFLSGLVEVKKPSRLLGIKIKVLECTWVPNFSYSKWSGGGWGWLGLAGEGVCKHYKRRFKHFFPHQTG